LSIRICRRSANLTEPPKRTQADSVADAGRRVVASTSSAPFSPIMMVGALVSGMYLFWILVDVVAIFAFGSAIPAAP
jgi:hypothetical protein